MDCNDREASHPRHCDNLGRGDCITAPVTLGRVLRSKTFSWFSITRATYGAGERLPLHVHERPYLTIVERSGFEITTTRGSIDCASGDVLYFPALCAHTNRYSSEETELMIIELATAGRSSCESPRSVLSRSGFVLPLSRSFRMASEIRRGWCREESGGHMEIESFVSDLVLAIESIDRGDNRPDPSRRRKLEEVRERVREDYRKPVGLSDLASAAGLHPAHLARAFRRRYGCSVGEYVRRRRIDRAARELRSTDMPIVEIGVECGFYDQAHFTRTFTKFMGVAPGAFRRLLRPRKFRTRKR